MAGPQRVVYRASVNRDVALAAEYDRARPRLNRIAYAVLGTRAEAEDVVSDCWLRLSEADRREPILDVDAWATVAVAHRALDELRSARRRREVYIGPWLPEPLVEPVSADPADRVTLDDSVSFALLVVLETLSPAERTAWVLHDLFGIPFAEVAVVVGRRADAVRQLAARARVHIAAGAARVSVDPMEHQSTVTAFAQASVGGDLAALVAVLDPDVVLTSDGGGQVSAARKPVYGAERVGRFVLGITGNVRPGQRMEPVSVNGALGFALRDGDELASVVSLTVHGGRVTRVDIVRAPAKLRLRAAGAGRRTDQ